MKTSESQNPENTSRPFGYWLKAADRLMAAEFATAFEGEHASRRDWRLLNIVDGTVPARRPLNDHKLHRLVERGWVAPEGEGWTLTDDGRAAKDRLGAIVDDIRSKVTDAVSAEEMATTLASLEKIARAFGWDEETPLPRGRRHGFGGHGHGREHGRGHGFPRGSGHDAHDHECRHEHGHGHGRRHGFDAGPASARGATPATSTASTGTASAAATASTVTASTATTATTGRSVPHASLSTRTSADSTRATLADATPDHAEHT